MADKSEYEIKLRAKPCYSEEVLYFVHLVVIVEAFSLQE